MPLGHKLAWRGAPLLAVGVILSSVGLTTGLLPQFSEWLEQGLPAIPKDATDSLLLAQNLNVKETDPSSFMPIEDVQGQVAPSVQRMIESGLNTIFDPAVLAGPPITSVRLTAFESGESPTYQLDVAIFVEFISVESAAAAKFDFDHAAFNGAFRAVLNLALQTGLGGRSIAIAGPPLQATFVSGPLEQIIRHSGYDVSYSASDMSNHDYNQIMPTPKSKSPKQLNTGPRKAKPARTSRSLQGSNPSHRQRNRHPFLESKFFGSKFATPSALAFLCAATVVLAVGYRRWILSDTHGQETDPFPETPPKPVRKQKVGNVEVLKWMQSEHVRLGSITNMNRSPSRSPYRRSPGRRSPHRKHLVGACPTSPTRKSRVSSPYHSKSHTSRCSPNRTNGNDSV